MFVIVVVFVSNKDLFHLDLNELAEDVIEVFMKMFPSGSCIADYILKNFTIGFNQISQLLKVKQSFKFKMETIKELINALPNQKLVEEYGSAWLSLDLNNVDYYLNELKIVCSSANVEQALQSRNYEALKKIVDYSNSAVLSDYNFNALLKAINTNAPIEIIEYLLKQKFDAPINICDVILHCISYNPTFIPGLCMFYCFKITQIFYCSNFKQS